MFSIFIFKEAQTERNYFPEISLPYTESAFDFCSISLQWTYDYSLYNTAFHVFLIFKRMFPVEDIVTGAVTTLP